MKVCTFPDFMTSNAMCQTPTVNMCIILLDSVNRLVIIMGTESVLSNLLGLSNLDDRLSPAC